MHNTATRMYAPQRDEKALVSAGPDPVISR